MNRKEQQTISEMPKELKKLIPFLKLVPNSTVKNEFKKIWNKKTKCLDDPTKNQEQIKKLQTNQTKKIKYKEKTVYDWLAQTALGSTSNQTKNFIKWYKTEYYKISLKDLGIFK